ncbi:MAG: citrate synthase, partial [Oscillospiraceae bacterium]|nr:citrate synthase [Oscillospiraceae bacterium]
MQKNVSTQSMRFIKQHADEIRSANAIDKSLYKTYDVKRGLRNADGTGVMAGITHIGNVRGYYVQDGEKVPMPGQLIYRGYDLSDLCTGFLSEGRFGYEETAYLLLFGELPDAASLEEFKQILAEFRALPVGFTEDVILAAPSNDIMNKLARAILTLYSYDPSPDTDYNDIEKELEQAMHLIARCPVIVANSFAAKRHYLDNESLYIHRPQDNLALAENFLYSVRRDTSFTEEEA